MGSVFSACCRIAKPQEGLDTILVSSREGMFWGQAIVEGDDESARMGSKLAEEEVVGRDGV